MKILVLKFFCKPIELNSTPKKISTANFKYQSTVFPAKILQLLTCLWEVNVASGKLVPGARIYLSALMVRVVQCCLQMSQNNPGCLTNSMFKPDIYQDV